MISIEFVTQLGMLVFLHHNAFRIFELLKPILDYLFFQLSTRYDITPKEVFSDQKHQFFQQFLRPEKMIKSYIFDE